jgi:hypothetical protein
MGTHIAIESFGMKTTIDIADDLFERVQQLARKEETSFRALTEAGLRLVLAERHHQRARRLPPLVTFGKDGPKEEFKDWNWERISEEAYKGRGT